MKTMRRRYDFSKAVPNPHARGLKTPVTIRLDRMTIGYFKRMAERLDMPYQTLINLYLRDCMASGRTLDMRWKPGGGVA
jgi:uncharacterized protein (DUF4415 family)